MVAWLFIHPLLPHTPSPVLLADAQVEGGEGAEHESGAGAGDQLG